jgi:hypothetical protein
MKLRRGAAGGGSQRSQVQRCRSIQYSIKLRRFPQIQSYRTALVTELELELAAAACNRGAAGSAEAAHGDASQRQSGEPGQQRQRGQRLRGPAKGLPQGAGAARNRPICERDAVEVQIRGGSAAREPAGEVMGRGCPAARRVPGAHTATDRPRSLRGARQPPCPSPCAVGQVRIPPPALLLQGGGDGEWRRLQVS